jgi:hypothetical protein
MPFISFLGISLDLILYWNRMEGDQRQEVLHAFHGKSPAPTAEVCLPSSRWPLPCAIISMHLPPSLLLILKSLPFLHSVFWSSWRAPAALGREAPTKGWRLLTTARARGRSDLGGASGRTSGCSGFHVLKVS